MSQPTLFGHPCGLYTLFFAEMWERFSYYGMRALLLFYMMKGFLGYNDGDAYTIYGAYTALVYMTPFFGGMLADRLLGARRAVIIGGLLMATGQACLMLPNKFAFYAGLGLLIVGNGFFKPNISNIVGTLYREIPVKRDGGFTIFYIGINLGASMSPLLCGYIGENVDWSLGFGLATVGMLVGLAVFILPPAAAQALIGLGALAAAGGLLYFHPTGAIMTAVNVFVAAALLISASVAVAAIHRGGLPADAGAPPDPERLRRRWAGILPVEWAVYLGALAFVPVFVLLVSGGAPLTPDNRPIILVENARIAALESSKALADNVLGVLLKQISTPAGLILSVSTLLAYGYLLIETFRMDMVARHRMFVVLILTFFCMLFWAFFEQAGSSINNFTDRNVDRVLDRASMRIVAEKDVGQNIRLQPTQEQLGFHNGDRLFTLDTLNKLRDENRGKPDFEIDWRVAEDNAGMVVARRADEIPASVFQAVNPVYIMLFGLAFSALWTFLGTHGLEHALEVRAGHFAVGTRLRGSLVRLATGRSARHGCRRLAALGILAAHDRRVVPFARRLVDDHEADARPLGQHGHGRLVPGDGGVAVPGGHDCPIHARRRRGGGGRGRDDPAALRDCPHLRQRVRRDRRRRGRRRRRLFPPRAAAETLDARRSIGRRARLALREALDIARIGCDSFELHQDGPQHVGRASPVNPLVAGNARPT